MKLYLLVFCALLGLAGEIVAAPERRVALAIGNNDYQNVVSSEKAVNDNAVAEELKKVGFEVQAYNNIGQKKMNQAINDFVQRVSGGGVGVFFFAGHGFKLITRTSLFLLIRDTPREPADVADQAISVPVLQDSWLMLSPGDTRLVLDACRKQSVAEESWAFDWGHAWPGNDQLTEPGRLSSTRQGRTKRR